MEDIDSLLTSGNIPDLFDFDELDSLLMEVKTEAMNEGISDEKSELNKFLINVSLLGNFGSRGSLVSSFVALCHFRGSRTTCTSSCL